MVYITQIADVTRIDCDDDLCYVCYDGESSESPFAVGMCACSGSMKIHVGCLTELQQTLNKKKCDTCGIYYPSKKYYDNGALKKEEHYSGNNLYSYTTYYEDGGIESTGSRTSNYVQHGTYKKYYPNGQLEVEQTFNNRKLEGPRRTYYQNGQLKGDVLYVNGNQVGEVLEYHENGVLSGRITIGEDGYREFLNYYDTGVLRKRWALNGRNYHGVFQKYYPDGTLRVDAVYEDSFIVGEYNEYYEDGSIMRHKPVISDTVYTYYRDGSLKELYTVENAGFYFPCDRYYFNNRIMRFHRNGALAFYKEMNSSGELKWYSNGAPQKVKWTEETYPSGALKMSRFSYKEDYDARDNSEMKYTYYSNGQIMSIINVDVCNIAYEIKYHRNGKLASVRKYFGYIVGDRDHKDIHVWVIFNADGSIQKMYKKSVDGETPIPEAEYGSYWKEDSLEEIHEHIAHCRSYA